MNLNPNELGIYSAKDLSRMLARIRGRPVPPDTLKRWRHNIGLTPDRSRLYSEEDYQTLKALVIFLKCGGNTPQFVNLAQQRHQSHDS